MVSSVEGQPKGVTVGEYVRSLKEEIVRKNVVLQSLYDEKITLEQMIKSSEDRINVLMLEKAEVEKINRDMCWYGEDYKLFRDLTVVLKDVIKNGYLY